METSKYYEYYKGVHEAYARNNLLEWLKLLRSPGRYPGMNGVNCLVNASPIEEFDREDVERVIMEAASASKSSKDSKVQEKTPYHLKLGHPLQGLSIRLNPYTDWALSQLGGEKPGRWYLILGSDWDSIGYLEEFAKPKNWFDYLLDPFEVGNDPFWHRLWAWILWKKNGENAFATRVDANKASEFIRENRAGFIFHNRIPYLRPPGITRSDKHWPKDEWKKPGVRNHIKQDLEFLLQLLEGNVQAYCTAQIGKKGLMESGFKEGQVTSWGAHPSYGRFSPKNPRVRPLLIPR